MLGPWVPVATYVVPVQQPNVASDGTYVYSTGGYDISTQNAYSITQRYDPVSNTWVSRANIPQPVFSTSAVYASNTNKVYVFSGITRFGTLPSNSIQIYDPATDTWTTRGPMPGIRTQANIAYHPITGKIYLIGGWDHAQIEQSQTWEYDPVANAWNFSRPSLPMGVSGSGIAVVGQYIHIVGTWGGGYGSNLHYRYDVVNNTWTARAPLPVNVFHPGAGTIGNTMYVFGGKNPSNPQNPYDSTWSYNTTTNTWSAGPSMNVAHGNTTGTAVGNRLIVVAGSDMFGVTRMVEMATGSMGTCATSTPTVTPTYTPTRTPTRTHTPGPSPTPTRAP
jgi:N-acetylneuraminic acid mutarotase